MRRQTNGLARGADWRPEVRRASYLASFRFKEKGGTWSSSNPDIVPMTASEDTRRAGLAVLVVQSSDHDPPSRDKYGRVVRCRALLALLFSQLDVLYSLSQVLIFRLRNLLVLAI